jgi:hypothetical protein
MPKNLTDLRQMNIALDKYEATIAAALTKLYNVRIDALADIVVDGEKVSGLAADSNGIVYEFAVDSGKYFLRKVSD